MRAIDRQVARKHMAPIVERGDDWDGYPKWYVREHRKSALGWHRSAAQRRLWMDDLEKAFAVAWEKTNVPAYGLNGGLGTLQGLLLQDTIRYEVTKGAAMAAATAIQWLSTNCGYSFLSDVLKSAGYKIVETEEGKALRDKARSQWFSGAKSPAVQNREFAGLLKKLKEDRARPSTEAIRFQALVENGLARKKERPSGYRVSRAGKSCDGLMLDWPQLLALRNLWPDVCSTYVSPSAVYLITVKGHELLERLATEVEWKRRDFRTETWGTS